MSAHKDSGCAEKLVCCCRIKPGCCLPAVVSIFTESAACVLSFYTPPLHYIFFINKSIIYSGGSGGRGGGETALFFCLQDLKAAGISRTSVCT